MDFNLSIPVRVYSGLGCVMQNSAVFKSFGKKCAIVTGGSGAKKSGALFDVTDALKKEEIAYIIYDKVGANPLLSACHEAGRLAHEFEADFIIGIGGGSALDASKAAAVFAANPALSPRDIYAVTDRKAALPLIAVGTTAGTGSEVDRVAVLSDDETGRKRSISPDDCYPKVAFADSRYTHSVPYSVTVSTALDALAHAAEGYFSPKCGSIPSMFAEKAFGMLFGGLRELDRTKEIPTEEIREQLYYGSLYAGIVLAYCGTAFPHPLGYILTENYGVPHGTACAAFMPELIERAARYESEKLQKLLSLTGETKESFISVINSLTDTGDISMTKKEIAAYCERWDESLPANFKFSPGGFTKEEAENVLESIFGEK